MVDLLLKTQNAPAQRIRPAMAYSFASFFFYLILFIFIIALSGYGGLLVLNQRQESTRQNLIEKLKAKEADLGDSPSANIFLLDQQFKGLQNLLDRHLFPSNLFAFLQQNTYPQVAFSNFSLSSDARRVDMAANTTSYAQLTYQIARFEQSPYIQKVDFGGLSRGDKNAVAFKLTLTFKDSIFKTKPAQFLQDIGAAATSTPTSTSTTL